LLNFKCNTLEYEFANALQISFMHIYKQVSLNNLHKCHNRKKKDMIKFSGSLLNSFLFIEIYQLKKKVIYFQNRMQPTYLHNVVSFKARS